MRYYTESPYPSPYVLRFLTLSFSRGNQIPRLSFFLYLYLFGDHILVHKRNTSMSFAQLRKHPICYALDMQFLTCLHCCVYEFIYIKQTSLRIWNVIKLKKCTSQIKNTMIQLNLVLSTGYEFFFVFLYTCIKKII